MAELQRTCFLWFERLEDSLKASDETTNTRNDLVRRCVPVLPQP